MQYTDKIDKAQEIACKALERMDREGLAPKPDNFELWYCFYSNNNPDMIKDINKVLKATGKITEKNCRELYDRHLSHRRDEDLIRKASDRINTAIEEIAEILVSVNSATHEYGDNLSDVTSQVRSAKSIDELGDVMSTLVVQTKRMFEHNQELENQLNTSSIQVQELRKDLDSVRREALTDALTGLANRKSFDSELRHAVARAIEEEEPMSLLMIDIDHFKSFNDNYGHQVGDQVLRLVAKTFMDHLKGQDVAARYGGEEFSIILPETPLQAAVQVANKLRKTVAVKDVINKASDSKLGRITISVGVAELHPGEPLPELIERADAALYTAKNNGRNQVAAAAAPKAKSKASG